MTAIFLPQLLLVSCLSYAYAQTEEQSTNSFFVAALCPNGYETVSEPQLSLLQTEANKATVDASNFPDLDAIWIRDEFGNIEDMVPIVSIHV